VEPGHPGPDTTTRNADIAAYSEVLRETAAARKALYVDLLVPSQKAYLAAKKPLTTDGLHLNDSGNRIIARVIAHAIVGAPALDRIKPARLKEVAAASSQLAHFVAEVVRPKNGILYYGQRKRAEEREAEIPLYLKRIEQHVEALNFALAAIPADRVRMHVCWGNYEGPHHKDVPLATILPVVMKAKPQALLFETSNPRHAHEWETIREMRTHIPDDKILVPGVLDSTTNFIEHPRLVAQRIGRFADIVAVRGDPAADVTLLEAIPVVIKGGEVVKDRRTH
jgi:hypothetical protein